MVVAVAAPHEAKVIAQLTNPDAAVHGPEMRIRQRNVHALQRDGMAHLAPVRIDHIGRGGHHGRLAEFRHHFPAAESGFRAAGVFHVSQHLLQIRRHFQRFLQAPAAIGIQVHPGIGECFFDGGNGLDLFLRGQHAALELEVFKSVFVHGGLGQRYDGVGCQGFLIAQPVPFAVGIFLAHIGQIGFFPVPNIEEVAEEPHPVPLNAVAHQRRGRQIQKFSKQVQQRRLDRRHHVYAGPQVKGLQAADIVLDVGVQPGPYLVQGSLIVGDGGAQNQILHIFQRFGDLLSAGDLAHAQVALAVLKNDHVSGKIRRVRTGQIQLHAVMARHRINIHFYYFGDHLVCLRFNVGSIVFGTFHKDFRNRTTLIFAAPCQS